MSQYHPPDAFQSPRFGQVATFMRLPLERDASKLQAALVGIPFDGGTSYRPGARFGPREIRNQSALIRPYNPVLKVDPFRRRRTADYGDIDVNPLSIEETFRRIEAAIAELVRHGVLPVCIGGDHSISLALLRALASVHGPLALVHFDAHPDTWDLYFGVRYSHGTQFRRATEEDLIRPQQTIQIGIRGQLYGEDDLAFSHDHGMRVITIEEVKAEGPALLRREVERLADSPVYLTFDIDVLDPSVAPGTGTPQIGGLDSFEALQLLRTLRGLNIVGCDLVEVSPPYDSASITSLVAANLLYEMLCILP
ncbi:MAG: agmatinase [Dehalococcoidia bacterium]